MQEAGDIALEVERTIERLDQVRREIGRVIFGQERVVDETLITILAGGHVLLVGVPGLAKTRLAQTLGTVLGLVDKRVQFTPDLMPADILGSEVLDETPGGQRAFRFIPGPVFAQLLMADEINRASPRTQAALLQAMQERKVTVAGHDHALPTPFHVLATQNPIEQEGTYPLPEAQLDRFFMQVNVDYPSVQAERRMMIATTTGDEEQPEPVLDGPTLLAMQQLVRRMPISDQLVDLILRLVRAGRPENKELADIAELVVLGTRPARQPGADARRARAGAARPAPGAVARGRAGAGRPGAAPPHGRDLRRPGAGDHRRRRGRAAVPARIMTVTPAPLPARRRGR